MNQDNYCSYKEFLSEITKEISGREDIILKKCGLLRYEIAGEIKNYRPIKIVSANIGPNDKILLITAGFHGNETAGPLTFLNRVKKIFDCAHKRGVKLIIYPLCNPSGFESRQRYNVEDDEGDPVNNHRAGNNDFLRYELENGKIVDDLGSENEFKRWFWSSDPRLAAKLPKETRLLHRELKKIPLSQVIGILDLHQDNYLALPGAYHYGFENFSAYDKIIKKISKKLRVLRNRRINAGYPKSPYKPKSDGRGFIVRHDGAINDLLYRIGAKYCVVAETTGVTPLNIAKEVNLIWIYGIIDLVKKEGL